MDSSNKPDGMRQSDWIGLILILGVAVAVRAVRLGSGLWYDEIMTLVQFVRLPTRDVVSTLSTLNNHVLYSLEAQAAIAVFGESAWSLRLPAMIFGVAGVGALWWLARQVVSAAEANIAALFLAVSYHHIWFSQNARGYTGIMFWSIVGTAMFIRGVDRPSWRVWIGYSCVIAAAAYTHLSAGFLFLVHGLVYLVIAGGRARQRGFGNVADEVLSHIKPVIGFALGGVLTSLLYSPVFAQLFHAIGSVAVTAPAETTVAEWKNPIWTLLEVVRNLRGLGPVASLGLPAVLGFTTIGAFSLGRRRPMLPALFLLHVPLTLVLLLAMSFRIWPRYFFIDLGFVFLCVVHGVFVVAAYLARSSVLVRRGLGTPEAFGIAASLAAVLCSIFLLPPLYRYPKQDFLGARNFVEMMRAPEDTVTAVGLAADAYSSYYAPSWKAVRSWPQITESFGSSDCTWVVYTSPLHMAENYPDVLEGLATGFHLIERFPGTLGDGDVFVYRRQNRTVNR